MVNRKQLNVRIDAGLNEDFNKACRESGSSTCSVIEGLLKAWLEGYKRAAAPNASNVRELAKNLTVNLKQERVVKKVRRKSVKYVPEPNHWKDGFWFYDDEHADEIIVEQSEEWGKNDCSRGFLWLPHKKMWVSPI